MSVTEEQRKSGVLCINAGRDVAAPGTHVLVVGVGAYPKTDLSPLTSPVVSARTIAGWFIGKKADGLTPIEDGFRNERQPLGSLALLLSDPADASVADTEAAPSSFAREPVLQATMPNMDAAVKAWVARARANRDNLAILYLSGHGFSDGKHTAFVLEDRDDGDDKNVTNGLIDLTMLHRRLARLPIRSQLLLFDCCRSPINLDVAEDDPIGEAFLDREASAGPDIQQMALFATLPKDVAQGRAGKPSFYAESLIMALTHAAAEKDTGAWFVASARLYSRMQRILQLFAVAEQRFQRLDSESMADFPIHAPTIPRDDVPTYVSVVDPSRWDDVTLTLKRDGQDDEVLQKVVGQRYLTLRLKFDAPITVTATYGDGTRAVHAGDPNRPVCFARVGEQGSATVSVTDVPATRGFGKGQGGRTPPPVVNCNDHIFKHADDGPRKGGAPPFSDFFDMADAVRKFPKAVIGELRSMLQPGADALPTTLRIVTPGEPARPAGLLSIENEDGSFRLTPTAAAAAEGLAIEPGRYRVTLDLADGHALSRTVEIAASKVATVAFDAGGSPREWLAVAAEAGALPMFLRDPELIGRLSAVQVKPVLLAPLTFGSEPNAAKDVGADVQPGLIAGPVTRIDVVESSGNRFRKAANGTPSERPLWLRVAIGADQFDLAMPAPGRNRCPSSWIPHVVALSQERGARATALVDAGPAASLFAFLGRRDFRAAGRALDEMLRVAELRNAIRDDANPVLSAVVAAAAIASGSRQEVIDDRWLTTFVEQHPSLPDAGVLAVRGIWNRGAFEDERDRVRELLSRSFATGVPILSLSLDWLARGLTELDETETRAMATAARSMAHLSIQSNLFTTIARSQQKAKP